MKTLRRFSPLGLSLLFAAISLSAQSSPELRFGGHALGETAETFFATAKVASSKVLAKDYCKSLLEDPKTKEKIEAARDSEKEKGLVVLNKQDFSLLDVSNCRQVMAALRGENSNVGARLASEIGKGGAFFASGKLMAFNLFWDSPYADAIADMEKRFGISGQKRSVTRSGWRAVREEMEWETDGVSASIFKDPFSDGAIIWVGYLQPPYDSLLRGTPAPQTPASSPASSDSAAPCERLVSDSAERTQVSSGVMTGLIVHKIPPTYPESAKQNHIEGTVTLQAVVDKCGHVGELTPISGPPELFAATVSAVQQWQYRPFLLAGKPAEVTTRITVNFKLSHSN
jgi:TonB family protein